VSLDVFPCFFIVFYKPFKFYLKYKYNILVKKQNDLYLKNIYLFFDQWNVFLKTHLKAHLKSVVMVIRNSKGPVVVALTNFILEHFFQPTYPWNTDTEIKFQVKKSSGTFSPKILCPAGCHHWEGQPSDNPTHFLEN